MATPTLLRARDALADGFAEEARSLAGPLVAGDADPLVRLAQWFARFLQLIRMGVGGAFRLGFGGEPDAPRLPLIESLVETQYGFARNFAADLRAAVAAGQPVSEAAVAARSALYAGGSVVAPFHRAEGERWGVVLPHYPGDGSTPCKGSCRCNVTLEDTGTEILAYWRARDGAGTCPGCKQRAASWNPLNLSKPPVAA